MRPRAPFPVLLLVLSLLVSCRGTSTGEPERRRVPLAEAVPEGWVGGEVEAFVERRERMLESLAAMPAERRGRFEDLVTLREGSLDAALAAEVEARVQAYLDQQREDGWRLERREDGVLHLVRP